MSKAARLFLAWFCRIPRDILISFEIGAREASRPELAGRHYEVLPERTWPAAGSGVAVDIEGACSSVEDLRGSHYERFNAVAQGITQWGRRTSQERRACIWDVNAQAWLR